MRVSRWMLFTEMWRHRIWDARQILTGKTTLQRTFTQGWQAGYDEHIQQESARRAMGGQ
jgi:hypothetical protein